MSAYSTLLRNTVFPLLLRRENRQESLRHLRFLQKSQYWPEQQLLDYQWEKLTALLKHAYDTTKYYRTVFDERGLTPASFKSFDDLQQLPLLTREIIDANREEIISSHLRREDLQEFGTGGTTTRRLTLYRDNPGAMMKLAIGWRFEQFMGQQLCDKVTVFWPPHVDFGHHSSRLSEFKDKYLLRMQVFYTGAATDETMRQFYHNMLSFRPHYLKCFPNALHSFTEFAQKHNLPLPSVQGIMSTGELLYPEVRTLFEETYQAPVFDMYGSREVGNTSSECERHEGHHIAMESSIVEFIDGDRAVAPGEEGEVIVTDLTNYGFPMIRYQLGDIGKPLDHSCSCGRTLRLMTAGIGRLTDRYVGLDGRRHSGIVFGVEITETGPPMGKMQIIQRTITDWHVRVTNDPEPGQELFDHIRNRMKAMVGEAINITIEVVDEIPPEKSGKTRFFKCEVPQ